VTLLDDIVVALEQRWTALGPLQALAGGEGGKVNVGIGAPIGGTFGVGLWLFVAWDGRPDSTDDARYDRLPLNLAGTRYREDGEITCTAVAQSGGKDIAPVLSQASAMVDACDADLRSDRTAGGVVWSTMITASAALQLKNDAGVAVLEPFTVAYSGAV
jgi:hypothetical protein